MDFENWLKAEFKSEAEQMEPPAHLKKRVLQSINKKTRHISKMNKALIACLLLLFLIPIGAFSKENIIPALMQKTFGTEGEAQNNWNVTPEGYQVRTQEMEAAQRYLTEKEFNHYMNLKERYMQIIKKAKPMEIHLMAKEDLNELKQVEDDMSKYEQKVHSHFDFSKKEAEKIMGFKTVAPTYIPSGYVFKNENVEAQISMNNPKPIVEAAYQKGEFGFKIYQSQVISGNQDPFVFQHIQNYKLSGHDVTFGYDSGSNVSGMKAVIKDEDGKPARQIVLNVDILSKSEAEKIMLSLLKEQSASIEKR